MVTHQMNARKFFGIVCLMVLWCSVIVGGVVSAAEPFPERPVTLIVPWAAGGGQDLVVRTLQPSLEKALGQPLVIVNKTGGGGAIGFEYIANSTPDGYTIGALSLSTHTIKYTVQGTKVDYAKFQPIVYIGYSPQAIQIRNDAPWKTLKEFIDFAKANPGKIRVGNSGYGSSLHFVALAVEQAAGVKFTHVPYKGSAETFPALMGGHIDATCSPVTESLPLVKGNKIRVIGIAAAEKNKAVPEAQTFSEIGIPLDFVSFYLHAGPKQMPQERVQIIYNAYKKAIGSKEFQAFCNANGITTIGKGPQETEKFLENEDKKYKELIMKMKP